jgi:hypothetical protein
MTGEGRLTSPGDAGGSLFAGRKMQKFAGVGLMFCCVSGLAIVPLTAAEFSSAYTSLKLDACKLLSKGGEEAQGGTWACKGYGGLEVHVSEGDARMFVAFGPNAEKQKAFGQTIPMFNTIGETLEWRLKKDGQGWTPIATILRYRWNVDERKGSTLVVTKLAKDNVCHMAYVEATNNAQANEQARAIADAGDFDCMHEPLNYDKSGSIIKD